MTEPWFRASNSRCIAGARDNIPKILHPLFFKEIAFSGNERVVSKKLLLTPRM